MIHDVPESVCPTCGNKQNCVVECTKEDGPPVPGDIVLCSCCGTTLIFCDDLAVRRLTKEEFHELKKEDQYELLLQLAFVVTDSPSKRIH